jgi:adenylate kinase
VPSSFVNKLIEERLDKSDTQKGYVLDGYPRNEEQAESLDKILHKRGEKLNYILYVDIEDEIIIERLSKRRTCPKCGLVYHLKYNPPKNCLICDICSSVLIQRSDDKREVLKKRLEVYKEKTKPLLKRYREIGLVVKIPGNVEINKLPKILKKILG